MLVFSACRDNGPTDGDKPPCLYCPFDFSLTDFYPAWSPDGTTIAYVHGDTALGKTGIYLIDTSGTNKRIVYAGSSASGPTWSPDGRWIVFSVNAQIFKMKINGDSLQQLSSPGLRSFFPSWSPNGQWIAYDVSLPEAYAGIWIMPISGYGQRIGSGNYPDWSADGMNIIYLRRVIRRTGPGDRDVIILGDSVWKYDIKADTSVATIFLAGQNYDNRFPRYSPDGNNIAFTSQPYGDKPQIWVMNADGSNPRQLTATQGYSCDWSPDAQWIVYTDSRATNGRLWFMRNDGSDKRQFTFE